VIAFVNPVEDQRARVLTNLIDVDPEDVTAGMPVVVVFESGRDDDDPDDDVVYFPLFRPEVT
jgi:uncharacterized OB-fold protein